MNKKSCVAIGMSGGVDSSVSALLLKEQGFEVVGFFMKNWEETNQGSCTQTSDYEDVVKVCELLHIPCYVLNFVEEYFHNVFSHFLEELKLGYTPNPDILCNREIKFKVFLQKAKQLGADYLATGHYCQIGNAHGEKLLLKGNDPNKDQSYFLYTLKDSVLSEILFPIGHLHKSQVRKIAKDNHLPVHDKKDSTGICFIGKRDFKRFISNYIPYQGGNFQNLKGKIVGRHDGAAYYTIGQRKGLGIGGPGDAWFVVAKDMEKNVVIIEQGRDHPSLYAKQLIAKNLSFVSSLPNAPFRCKAKIRYRQEDQDCCIQKIEENTLTVSFENPQRAITPRQSIVFYVGNVCLGGAMIEKALIKTSRI